MVNLTDRLNMNLIMSTELLNPKPKQLVWVYTVCLGSVCPNTYGKYGSQGKVIVTRQPFLRHCKKKK